MPGDLVERGDEVHLRGAGVGEADVDAAVDQRAHQAFGTVHLAQPLGDAAPMRCGSLEARRVAPPFVRTDYCGRPRSSIGLHTGGTDKECSCGNGTGQQKTDRGAGQDHRRSGDGRVPLNPVARSWQALPPNPTGPNGATRDASSSRSARRCSSIATTGRLQARRGSIRSPTTSPRWSRGRQGGDPGVVRRHRARPAGAGAAARARWSWSRAQAAAAVGQISLSPGLPGRVPARAD